MGLDASLVGRSYPASAAYEVGREEVRRFASAVRTGDGGEPVAAPPTYPFVVAWRALQPLLEDPGLGIALERVVHGEQRFALTRALVPGDRVSGTATVESVRVLGPAALVAVRVDLTAAEGPLGSAWSTLVISSAASGEASA
ncbi:MaoC dehydratase-like protein [Motilibacter rhizosphaerae]|uniref:MaoC dehydratase-like protein n=1 Tax=Motilibacter rhizosphaerae TaxID=598652 RepID=A0A4Q7N9Z2_9ACTN|nr:MaoC family dehydratase N-terminal domain-containing protein [Motilibacter rhizosphaerae]RZS78985.1 MaoC dehydratase-like protein [Motilibacter rhizosphaerae]